ncbi:MAG TPA: hypothetical protein VEZ72_23720 [Paenibacillus sp.]|nr:hypothetical protein [Paenibacillus sp.]
MDYGIQRRAAERAAVAAETRLVIGRGNDVRREEGAAAITEQHGIRIEHGRISGGLGATGAASSPAPSPYWDVPPASEEAVRRAARELAEEPALDGRWRAGLATEDERERLGAGERGWRSGCDCGQRQPCRHAQSLLFRFRQEAKRDPWLWWEAAGVERERLAAAVRARRAELADDASEAEAASETRAVREARDRASRSKEPWLLRRSLEPAFWNRDATFAEWLRPLADAVRAKEEHHDAENDHAVDPHVRERP